MRENKSTMPLLDRAIAAHDKGRHAEAFKLFDEGAAAGNVEMLNWLATLHEAGLGTPIDYDRAQKLYQKAWNAERHAHVAANLGGLFAKQGNVIRAKIWLRKAMILGDGDAAVELAKLYAEQGRPQDYRNAKNALDAALKLSCLTPDGKASAIKLLDNVSAHLKRQAKK